MKETNNIQITKLAQYRKKRGLSQQQIADSLRLSRGVVKCLEEGQFDKVGAAPYLRGHLISYCKQVGIEPQQILTQLPPELLQHQNVQRAENLLPKSISQVKIKTGHFGRYLAGTGLLTILLFSVYFIWDKANPFQPPVDNADTTLSSNNEQTITYSSMLPPVSKDSYQEPSQNGIQATTSNEQAETKIETPAPATATEQQPSSIEKAAQMATETEQPQSTESEVKIEAGRPIESNQANVEQQPTSEQSFSIEFDLPEQAWVSVKTEQGENIIHDLIGPGKRTYQSDQAMSFKIGNAKQVGLRINGETITLRPFIKKNVAKFNWPPTESQP